MNTATFFLIVYGLAGGMANPHMEARAVGPMTFEACAKLAATHHDGPAPACVERQNAAAMLDAARCIAVDVTGNVARFVCP